MANRGDIVGRGVRGGGLSTGEGGRVTTTLDLQMLRVVARRAAIGMVIRRKVYGYGGRRGKEG